MNQCHIKKTVLTKAAEREVVINIAAFIVNFYSHGKHSLLH